jgi:nucleoside-diphosphate-sugar epimerase
MNIGTGPTTRYSINQLAELIAGDKIGNLIRNKRAVYTPSRPAEIMHSSANILKAKKLLNWQPKVSLKQGIKRMVWCG